MIVYKDMTFCGRKDCSNVKCTRHLSNVPDKLPEYMGVAVSDFAGKMRCCPAEMKEGAADATDNRLHD